MLWTEIRKWAKEKGYSTTKNSEGYTWSRLDKPEISGTTTSVSKLAKAIFNDLTDNKWSEFQIAYKEKYEPTRF